MITERVYRQHVFLFLKRQIRLTLNERLIGDAGSESCEIILNSSEASEMIH